MEFISYHLFSFRRSVQEYKIHIDMEIVTFLWIKKWKQHNSVQQSYGLVQYWVSEEYEVFSIVNIKKVAQYKLFSIIKDSKIVAYIGNI